MTEENTPNSDMQTSSTNNEEKTWAIFAHLSSLAGFLIPFGNLLGPLIVWLVKKDTMPMVDDQGKESLNFQITIAIAGVISFILMFVLIGFFLMIALAIFWLVFVIIASIKTNEGVTYRYPLTIRFIK